jgi:hypothetical protein
MSAPPNTLELGGRAVDPHPVERAHLALERRHGRDEVLDEVLIDHHEELAKVQELPALGVGDERAHALDPPREHQLFRGRPIGPPACPRGDGR